MDKSRKFKVCFEIWCPNAKSDDSILVTGNLKCLGNWSPDQSVRLYTNRQHPFIWKTKKFELEFQDFVFEYKYMIRSGGSTIYEDFEGNRIINLKNVNLEDYDPKKQFVKFYDHEFSSKVEVNISTIPMFEDEKNEFKNEEALVELRTDFDLSYSKLQELKANLNEHKLPIEEMKNELVIKYDKVIEKVSTIYNDIFMLGKLSKEGDIINLLNNLLIGLKDCKFLSDELFNYISFEIVGKSIKTESKFSEIQNLNNEIRKEKYAIFENLTRKKEEFSQRSQQLKNEYSKNNYLHQEERQKDGQLVNMLGPIRGDIREFFPGNKFQTYEFKMRVIKSHIDDMEANIKYIMAELRSLTHIKDDLDSFSKVFKYFIEKITLIANNLTKGGIFLDELITGIAFMRSGYENFKLTQSLSSESRVNFKMADPKSFRNETLNIKEFEERFDLLRKNQTPLSPKSQTELSCLSQYMENYMNGKLHGRTIEINRLSSETAYYFVKIPEKKIYQDTNESIHENLNKCRTYLNTCFDQKSAMCSCLADYSSFINSQIGIIDTKIDIRQAKCKLLDSIQSKKGAGESQTYEIFELAAQFMKMEGLKGVLMIARKDRHDSDAINCPIVETESYLVYLGIQHGSIKMKSYKGGFLNLTTFYHRGYENWRFGGVAVFPTPEVKDNGISIVNPEFLKDIGNMPQIIYGDILK